MIGTQYRPARVHGPCRRAVFRDSVDQWTGAREHGPRTRVSKMTPVFTAREHGYRPLTGDHTDLPDTHTCIHNRMSHVCLYSQPQSITAPWSVLISRPAEGMRLSWSGSLVTGLRRRSLIPLTQSNFVGTYDDVIPLRRTATKKKKMQLEMWGNAKRDGRPAEHMHRPLFNAAQSG